MPDERLLLIHARCAPGVHLGGWVGPQVGASPVSTHGGPDVNRLAVAGRSPAAVSEGDEIPPLVLRIRRAYICPVKVKGSSMYTRQPWAHVQDLRTAAFG